MNPGKIRHVDAFDPALGLTLSNSRVEHLLSWNVAKMVYNAATRHELSFRESTRRVWPVRGSIYPRKSILVTIDIV